MNPRLAELESSRIENLIGKRGGVLNIAWRTVCMG